MQGGCEFNLLTVLSKVVLSLFYKLQPAESSTAASSPPTANSNFFPTASTSRVVRGQQQWRESVKNFHSRLIAEEFLPNWMKPVFVIRGCQHLEGSNQAGESRSMWMRRLMSSRWMWDAFWCRPDNWWLAEWDNFWWQWGNRKSLRSKPFWFKAIAST